MNWSMYTADRTTHLKIVVVGLCAALLIAVIGISARELNLGTDIMTAQSPTVIKAGGPVVFTDATGRHSLAPVARRPRALTSTSPASDRTGAAFAARFLVT